jgi:hypothetical protein
MAATRTKKRTWTKPRTECLESRPEVSAYAGDSWPWPRTR